uniref:Uncharacterized protein n=1 Tax=Anguilla anguilla TaxID=7936 RepID=A0A0E9R4E1_ANGAN
MISHGTQHDCKHISFANTRNSISMITMVYFTSPSVIFIF